MIFSYAVIAKKNYTIKSLTYIALVRISLLKEAKPVGEAWHGKRGKTKTS